MYQCTHCQAELAANAQFCARCGTPVEESQTRSADLAKASADEADLETTPKLQAVSAPAAPALPTLRTRRMHPKSSISTFPQDPWLPPGSVEDEDNTTVASTSREELETSSPAIQPPLTPPVEPAQDSPLILEKPADSASSVQTELAQPEESDEPAQAAQAALAQPEEPVQPAIDELDTISLPATAPEEVSAQPTSDLAQVPASSATTPEEIPAPPADDPALTPTAQSAKTTTSAADDRTLSPVPPATASVPADDKPTYVPSFPPPAPEKKSTPRPATPLPPSPSRKGGRAGRSRMLVVVLIVALVVLAAGAGAFALVRQQTAPGASSQCSAQQTNCSGSTPMTVHGKPTSLTFSGKVTGLMSIVAKPRCQSATSGNLRTLTVNLSGTINDHLYNFGFVIARYNGPGTYSNSTASITILFDVPGESTTNGWGNSAPTDSGSITVERGEQTGSISYTLSGVGTQAGTQIQASGNWTCGN